MTPQHRVETSCPRGQGPGSRQPHATCPQRTSFWGTAVLVRRDDGHEVLVSSWGGGVGGAPAEPDVHLKSIGLPCSSPSPGASPHRRTTLEHRGSQAATATEESPMSLTDAGKFTNAATLSHPAGPPVPPPPGGEHTSVQRGAASEGALATDPPPSRPVTAARVGPCRNLHPRPYNDSCNYLG